jgi:hypothetical protein
MIHDGRRTLGCLAIAAALVLGARVLAVVQSQPINSDPTKSTWGLDRIDQPVGTDGFFHYDATGKDVNIFIIGTGVLSTHDDFKDPNTGLPRVQYVGDFCTPNQQNPRTTSIETDPGDFSFGHETHVASFAAGRLSGVAKEARIYSLRTTWQSADGIADNGGSACNDQSSVATAVTWLVNHGHTYPDGIWRPAVVNYSGGSGTSAVQSAIDTASNIDNASAGYLFTLSGDTGGAVSAHWGTTVPNEALVVGGTYQNDVPLNSNNDYGSLLGLYAPASNLLGASKLGNSVYNILDPETVCQCGGDSFAAPFVAGVAAAFLQLHPNATPRQVRTRILNAATPRSTLESNKRLLQSAPATLTSLRRPADFDGDGKTDLTVFRPSLSPGVWFVDRSTTNFNPSQAVAYAWGNRADILVPGDYDGDGIADVAVFRPYDTTCGLPGGVWFIRNSSTGSTSCVQWGNGLDIPVPGDYDGDGKTDIAVFRPSNGTWLVHPSGGGSDFGYQWGNGSDVPVPGDYDGDGKTDIAVFRPSNGTWYIVYSSTGGGVGSQWGNGNDVPVPGDYDGDGKTDIAVFRPANGTWYIVYSSTGAGVGYQWGNGLDVPANMSPRPKIPPQ